MITSALIAQCRREYQDEPKSVRVSRQGNGSVNLFNVGKFPVVEGSYLVYVSGALKTENTDFNYNLDNGDLQILATPANGIEVKSEHKYAFWRDLNWVEAINQAIDDLNGKGYFRQTSRVSIGLSANVSKIAGPSGCVDVYEFLVSDNFTTSGRFKKPFTNWSYQQDSNQLVMGSAPTSKTYGLISYLRNMRTYPATSATVDVKDDWLELIKKKAGAIFYRGLAAKIAKQGNATIDEGHFSFTNLRTMAVDLDNEFENKSKRKKPTRPAKDMQFNIPESGA